MTAQRPPIDYPALLRAWVEHGRGSNPVAWLANPDDVRQFKGDVHVTGQGSGYGLSYEHVDDYPRLRLFGLPIYTSAEHVGPPVLVAESGGV